MEKDKIKRVNLRLNIEDPIDSIIWNYIKNEKKKGTYIKKIIYDMAIGNISDNEESKKTYIDEIDESELDDSGMEGF